MVKIFKRTMFPGLQKRNNDKGRQEGPVELFRVMETFCILIMVWYTNKHCPNSKTSNSHISTIQQFTL